MIRKSRLNFLIILAAIIVFGVGLFYFQFSSRQIYQESVNHLEEIYSQVNITFNSMMSKNWKILEGWENYIRNSADASYEEFIEFIEEEKNHWYFTEFYFLSEDGNYITAKGDTGYLNLSGALDRLVDNKEKIVMDCTMPSTSQITVFAVPVEPDEYMGFSYVGIALGFNSANMRQVLTLNSYSGKTDFYVTYSDGRILFAPDSDMEGGVNFLTYLRKNAVVTGKTMEEIEGDWKNRTSGIVLYKIDGIQYYLSYQPVGFSDWILVGAVPVDIVNESMNVFTTVTLLAMGSIFLLITLCVIALLIAGNRQRVREKNNEIAFREKLFDLLTQNTNDIFVLFSPEDYKASYVSPNIERVLGMNEQALYEDIHCLIEGGADKTDEFIASILPDSVRSMDREFRHNKSGERRWFKELFYRSSLKDDERIVIMLSDRTEEHRMNELLEDALNTAKAANEAKSNFLSNMSHDIRTPMNAIVGFSAMLMKNADKPQQVRDYTKKITSSSQHLLSLINDILDMSKIESGKTSLNLTEFVLPDLINELYTMMLSQARAKGQDFEINTKGNLPDRLIGDKLRLNQVLINLLSNAVKYTQEGGWIRLTIQELPQKSSSYARMQFVVADNGFGMSEAFVETIFEPFSREVTAATREIQGTGLGMAITKNIIELMGGTINVESELGKGSTFTVTLQFALSEQEQDDDFWARHSISHGLIVDDDEDICLDVQRKMREVNVDMEYATDGETAVEMVSAAKKRDNGFAVILLDWKMQGMGGAETARQLRKQIGNEVPILVLTSFDYEDIREEAGEAGIDLFLQKPFFLTNFRRVLSAMYEEGETGKNGANSDISLKGLKVLAAEDNEINAEILQYMMADEQVECEVVKNGKEAVERFAQSATGQFDMIFMDIQMPVMDGYEATKAIRAGSHPNAKSIPIIAMTANAFEEDIQSSKAAGMDAHITKPFDIAMLKAVVSMLQDQTQTM